MGVSSPPVQTFLFRQQRSNLYLCALASTATHVAEFAAPAAPVLLALLHGTLLGREAEAVERLAADLTKNHLAETVGRRGSVQSHRSQGHKEKKGS